MQVSPRVRQGLAAGLILFALCIVPADDAPLWPYATLAFGMLGLAAVLLLHKD